jgi:hypothetical protein
MLLQLNTPPGGGSVLAAGVHPGPFPDLAVCQSDQLQEHRRTTSGRHRGGVVALLHEHACLDGPGLEDTGAGEGPKAAACLPATLALRRPAGRHAASQPPAGAPPPQWTSKIEPSNPDLGFLVGKEIGGSTSWKQRGGGGGYGVVVCSTRSRRSCPGSTGDGAGGKGDLEELVWMAGMGLGMKGRKEGCLSAWGLGPKL